MFTAICNLRGILVIVGIFHTRWSNICVSKPNGKLLKHFNFYKIVLLILD